MLNHTAQPHREAGKIGEVPRSPALPSRVQAAAWVILLCTALFLALRSYNSFQIGVTQDDAEYAVLAKSLVQSDRYGLINDPDEPGRTRYPFGYPLLLSPLALLFPETPDALKMLSLAATVLNGILLFWGWRWFSPSTSSWWGLAAAGLYLLSPRTINQSRTVMSEPIFTTLCLVSILIAQSAREKPPGALKLTALSAVLLLTLFTKTAGAALVVVIGLSWIIRWGKAAWRPLAFLGVGMLVLLGAVVAATPIEIRDILPSEYAEQFTSPSRWGQDQREDSEIFRAARGVSEYLTQHIRQLVLPVGGGQTEQAFFDRLGLPFIPGLFGLLISGVIGLGFTIWLSKESFSIPALFALLFLAIMMVWSWRGPRYLHPIQPQLYLALLLGTAAVLDRLSSVFRTRTFITPLLLGAFCLGLMALYAVLNYPIVDSRLHTGDLQGRASWLKEHTGPAAILLTEQPQIDYLYSSRKTVPYGNFSTESQLEDYLSKHRVTHILIAPQLEWKDRYTPSYSPASTALLDLLQTPTAQERYPLVFSSAHEGLSVYQINP